MKRTLLIIALLTSMSVLLLQAQPPKRELRAVWLTTAWANDWPKDKISSGAVASAQEKVRQSQKDELTDMLDKLKENNVNTVYFQVRGMCDAMYKSSYEPWSQYLSNKRGFDPGYDPLAFIIEEAHERGMELHAWINPYRYSSASASHGNLATDYANTHPEWLMDYGKYVKILNPGLPEVRERIVAVIEEIVTNYDVDGVLFDDYFYVNQSDTWSLDAEAYAKYNPDKLSQADWRRQNVNKMVADVYTAIKQIKPYVAFGISPAGVASSDAKVASGHGISPSPGSDWQYNGIFSDPVAWLKQGTVDYISPQLYWPLIGSSTSGMYENLTSWWSEVSNRFGRYYYSSNSVSGMKSSADTKRVAQPAEVYELAGEEVPAYALSSLERGLLEQKRENASTRAADTDLTYAEMAREAGLNREYDWNGAPGFVFFSAAQTLGNHKYPDFADFLPYMKTAVFSRPSLNLPFPWIKPEKELGFVDNIALSGKTLTWQYADDDVRYAVYAVPNADRNDDYVFSNSEYLLGVSYGRQYTLPSGVDGATHKIAVSVLDRYGNEAPVRVMGEPLGEVPPVTLSYPADGADDLIFPFTFSWEALEGVDAYRIELSREADFSDLLYARDVCGTELFSGRSFTLDEDAVYYWRVKAYKANAPVSVSEVRALGGVPFSVLSPVDEEAGVALTPVIRWAVVDADAEYTVEISESGSFYGDNVLVAETLRATEWTVPANTLSMGRTYYLRVTAQYDGHKVYTPVSTFTTLSMEAEAPVILSPADGARLDGTSILLTWREQLASGFQAQLSEKETFPPRTTTVVYTDAYTYEALFEDLTAGTYYLRVLAEGNSGLSDPSPTITVHLGVSGVEWIVGNKAVCYRLPDGSCQVSACVGKQGTAQVTLYTLSGKRLWSGEQNVMPGVNRWILPSLDRGMYVLRLTVDGEEWLAQTVVY